MAEYIKLEELMKFPIRRNHYDKEHGNEDFICGIETVLEYAENLPAADVEPVVPGRWVEWLPGDCALIMTGEEMLYRCSSCDAKYSDAEGYKYCPNCGAKMDEVSE